MRHELRFRGQADGLGQLPTPQRLMARELATRVADAIIDLQERGPTDPRAYRAMAEGVEPVVRPWIYRGLLWAGGILLVSSALSALIASLVASRKR